MDSPVEGVEVVKDMYKFDFPFLADKRVWEKTINQFKIDHPELKINYIYTGPSELNSKKKNSPITLCFYGENLVNSITFLVFLGI